MSFSSGAALFTPGEYILLRVPGSTSLEDETIPGSVLPPTSSSSTPQHFSFIHNATFLKNRSFLLEVYCLLSFSTATNPVDHVINLPDADRKKLIPLPPLSDTHPPPELFGPPLNIRGWRKTKPAWLNVTLKRFIMPRTRSFKRTIPSVTLTLEELAQIDDYRFALAAASVAVSDIEPYIGGAGGSAAESGGTGSGKSGGRATGGGFRSSREGTQEEVGELQDTFESGSQYSGTLMVLEDVDRDATGEECTLEDEYALLAYQDKAFRTTLLHHQKIKTQKLESVRQGRVGQWVQSLQLVHAT